MVNKGPNEVTRNRTMKIYFSQALHEYRLKSMTEWREYHMRVCDEVYKDKTCKSVIIFGINFKTFSQTV